ncbi:MAG: lipopolysaccharide assembly outer membrane protein LptD (OstA) [Polaribacter sp.]
MKKFILFILVFASFSSFSQAKKIQIIYAGVSTADEEKYPGATILTKDKEGLVKIYHEGAILTAKRIILYKKRNFAKAFGNVLIKQGDTITQTSDYVDYDGNTKKALSWGGVVLKDPKMTLTTDTLNFDRQNQLLFYKNHAIIQDETNVLKSKIGNYFLENKKFTATTKVTVTNPEHVLESNHLDYYTDSAHAYLYGPSTIKGKDNTIYTEKGFYNTKSEISHFVKNSKIYFTDKTIEGDSLYYDKYKGFASATNNIQFIDTVQNFIAKGNYAEFFELKDSVFIVDRAVAISLMDKDSLYIHGDTLLITGKPEKRIMRIFNDVKIFKKDMQGKADSIHMNQTTGITRMFRNPILWSGKNQITGDSIQLLKNLETDKLDSLKILNNALIVQLDTIIDGVSTYNQIKGRNMFGKFIDGKLKHFLVKGNAEVVYYNRGESGVLETITKQKCSSIEFTLDATNNIESIKYIKKPEGTSYPPEQLPTNARTLKGFIWREDEQPKTMEDIFVVGAEISRKKKASNSVVIKKKE